MNAIRQLEWLLVSVIVGLTTEKLLDASPLGAWCDKKGQELAEVVRRRLEGPL
jgi:hypothetical protein